MTLRRGLGRLWLSLGLGPEARRLAEQEHRAVLAGRARRALTADAMLNDGALPLALLALTARGPTYGYGLIQSLDRLGFTVTREREVYPALGRMEVAGLLEGYLVPSAQGPARKYYRLLPEGERALAGARGEWRDLSVRIASLLNERP